MRFMFMIFHDEDVLEALQPARTARTIRVRGGTVSTIDGPFAETKEQLGSSSSRRRTWTRRARSPRGSRRRALGSSKSARSRSRSTPSRRGLSLAKDAPDGRPIEPPVQQAGHRQHGDSRLRMSHPRPPSTSPTVEPA
jgi:hypothetical protein